MEETSHQSWQNYHVYLHLTEAARKWHQMKRHKLTSTKKSAEATALASGQWAGKW